jgi:hypothetical protein
MLFSIDRREDLAWLRKARLVTLSSVKTVCTTFDKVMLFLLPGRRDAGGAEAVVGRMGAEVGSEP